MKPVSDPMPLRIDSYEAAIQFLYGRINYERVDAQAYSTSDFKLDRMRTLLMLAGNPQDRIPAVHVAGTKGKGSTCSMIAGVLASARYRVGLYISPHISVFEERITVNGVRPTHDELIEIVNRLLPVVAEMDKLPGQMQPTYFELATLIAWLFFVDKRVDMAVLETGLGGRLDSTNICRPKVCVITNISRDHTHILGSTVRKIAWEKAGIIKPGVPAICGVTQPDALELVKQVCNDRGSKLILLGREVVISNRRKTRTRDSDSAQENLDHSDFAWIDVTIEQTAWSDLPVALRGAHQAVNTALAVAALNELKSQGNSIPTDAFRHGLRQVVWPARVEVVKRQPIVIIDAAHNWESARALVATLEEDFAPRRRILIFAASRDKDISGLLRLVIPKFDTIILTRYQENPRSVPIQELRDFVHAVSNRQFHVADNPAAAWQKAKQFAGRDDLIAITGSFFLIAELREHVKSDQQI